LPDFGGRRGNFARSEGNLQYLGDVVEAAPSPRETAGQASKKVSQGAKMKTFLVVTITCPDRPGIVERVTDVVVAHGGNWEESRLARLGGDFAGIVLVSVLPQQAHALTAALTALTHDEMTVTVKKASSSVQAVRPGYTLCSLHLEGADHEGIVHDVTAYLSRQGINVEAMETTIVAAPMSATPLFQMEAQLAVPPSLTIDVLRDHLRSIGDQLGVGIEVQPLRQPSTS
jgi:glycine cleavage system transcriptional repressor